MYTGLQCVDNIVLITYHGFKNTTCLFVFVGFGLQDQYTGNTDSTHENKEQIHAMCC